MPDESSTQSNDTSTKYRVTIQFNTTIEGLNSLKEYYISRKELLPDDLAITYVEIEDV